MFQWLKTLLFGPGEFGADRDPQWRRVRAKHLLVEPVCQVCGKAKELDVHHIIPVAFDPSKELDPHNLITLCRNPCHLVFGHFLSYRCYNRNVREMAKAYKLAFDQRICLPDQNK